MFAAVNPRRLRWFHGDTADREHFRNQRWDRDSSVHGSPLAEGPGLYFTTSVGEARGYGPHLYEAVLRPDFRLMPKRKPTKKLLRDLWYMASDEEKERFLSNFEEGTNPGRALAPYLRYPDMHYAAVILYNDLFMSPESWIEAVKFAGYDGVLYERENSKHLVVWNLERMQIRQISPPEEE